MSLNSTKGMSNGKRYGRIACCLVAVMLGVTSLARAQGADAPVAKPVAGAQTPAAKVAAVPTPSPKPVDPAKRAQCERYVDVLAGRKQDAALMGSADVKELAKLAQDLVVCAAVKTDSEALCGVLGQTLAAGKGNYDSGVKDCTMVRARFQELRNYPKGRSFMFEQYEECKASGRGTLCDAFRDALRSGDPKNCASTGKLQAVCRAFIALDPKLCPPEDSEQPSCKQPIERKAYLGKGLKGISDAGSAREREFAKAALGEADACAPLAERAMQICTGVAPPSPSPDAATSVGTVPAPAGTPASKTPAVQGGAAKAPASK